MASHRTTDGGREKWENIKSGKISANINHNCKREVQCEILILGQNQNIKILLFNCIA